MPTAAVSTDLSIHPGALRATPGDRPRDAGLRGRLRSATAAAHARLDRRLAAVDLTRLPDYRRFLEASADALLPLEAALAHAGVEGLFPDWSQRSRADAISRDLARLAGEARPLAAPGRLTPDGVLGTMYVLEGSRLGARVLVGMIARSADPLVASATAYLRHGAGLALWPSFLAALEGHAAMADQAAVVDGACTAFDLFDTAFARAARASQPVSPVRATA
jgi:heme oxygenase